MLVTTDWMGRRYSARYWIEDDALYVSTGFAKRHVRLTCGNFPYIAEQLLRDMAQSNPEMPGLLLTLQT